VTDLALALQLNEYTRPLLENRVDAPGLRLLTSRVSLGEMFWRQLKFAEFDASEMSISSLIIATARGNREWVVLPVFTTRWFFHTEILVRTDSPMTSPAELRGKRVGVIEYQQTSVVWIRGILQHEFGVAARHMHWTMERPLEVSHGGATGFRPPPGVELAFVRPRDDLGKLLLRNELDALLFYPPVRDVVDPHGGSYALVGHPGVRKLFPDAAAEGRRYFAATGMYPINHCVVVRRQLAETDPSLVERLYAAFTTAKHGQEQRRSSLLEPYRATGLVSANPAALPDPAPYGFAANRATIAAISTYLYEQGLTDRLVELAEIIPPSMLGT
jgi:4,5-dihydroxyphthalate decarboxylase